MRRLLLIAATALVAASAFATLAWAGSPHFVAADVTRTGDSLTVTGKEAGLGNESWVHIELSATALCINPGGKHPKAENKGSFSSAGEFPVQNGKADFELTLTPQISPDCSPPMTLVFTDVTVSDTEHGVTKSFPGTF
jgi:hypothetical protein